MKRVLLSLALAFASTAAVAAATPAHTAVPSTPAHTAVPYMGAISADASGRVLYSDHAEREAYPASVTKLMTAMLVLEDVRAGRYAFTDEVTATADVRYSEPSWVGIKAGEKMSVRDLLLALFVESANDAAIVLGVHSAGSLTAFIERMNERALELGMLSTHYYNPNGLPPDAVRKYPWKKFNSTTAADQLRLALRLVTYPEIFRFTSVKTCDLVKTAGGYRVSVTRQVNRPLRQTKLAPGETKVKTLVSHNNIMVHDASKIFNADGQEAVDGLKTGYISAGGCSVVLTATRGGKRAIVVVLGSAPVLDAKGRVKTKGVDVRDERARHLMEDALMALTL